MTAAEAMIEPIPVPQPPASEEERDKARRYVQGLIVDSLTHLRAVARFLTGNRERADDLVQDAIVRALAAAHQFQPGSNFKAWIFTILRNEFYNSARKNRLKVQSLDDTVIEVVGTPATQDAQLELDDFRRSFWLLSPEHREVLMLVGASGISYDEASEICGVAVGTIKSRVSRARRELARLMEGGKNLGKRGEGNAIPVEFSGEAPDAGGPRRIAQGGGRRTPQG
ncbi:sigma-70 family RNA polymerase sigma factor [Zavarzinia sp. CC-PAN008]|uniref:sigma-70 family RNA polymerase sigma factor n=1 Tax=Zavarzinia sp. CC-PAN008 TaxID=3243332 RepID=UPI003F743C50